MRRFAIPTILAIVALLSAGLGERRVLPDGQPATRLRRPDRAEEAAPHGHGAGDRADQRRDRHRRRRAAPELTQDRDRLQPLRQRLDRGPADLRRERARADDIRHGAGTRAEARWSATADSRPTSTSPGTNRSSSSGDMLAFNAKQGRQARAAAPRLRVQPGAGRPSSSPSGSVHVKKGTFGTIFVAHIPKIAAQLRLRHQRLSDLRPPLHATKAGSAASSAPAARRPSGFPARSSPSPAAASPSTTDSASAARSPATAGSADRHARAARACTRHANGRISTNRPQGLSCGTLRRR